MKTKTFSLKVIFLIPLFLNSLLYARESIVYMGDSLSLNDGPEMSAFSKEVYNYANSLPDVTLNAVIACGFNAYDWTLPAASTQCGYLKKKSNGEKSYSVSARVPGISSIIEEFKPTMFIFQGGTNSYAFVKNISNPMNNSDVVGPLKEIKRRMLGTESTPRKCLWITPPYTSSKGLAAQEALASIIEKVAAPECQVFRSLEKSKSFFLEKQGHLKNIGYHPFSIYNQWAEWIKPELLKLL